MLFRSVTATLNNYSNAGNNWCNYVIGFANKNMNLLSEGYGPENELGVVRADLFAWGSDAHALTFTGEGSWGAEWREWLQLMTSANVTITMKRNGGEITIDPKFVSLDAGTEMTSSMVLQFASQWCFCHTRKSLLSNCDKA